MFEPDRTLNGILHVHVAFDWGDEVDLEAARRLVPAEPHEIARRRRTPSSISYRPPPLRFALEPRSFEFPELGTVPLRLVATVFDFGAVSVALQCSFALPPTSLRRLAGWLAEPTPLIRAARTALEPLHRQLLASIHSPLWQDDMSEEYIVFQFPSVSPVAAVPVEAEFSDWLAGLVRLEALALSPEEIAEALRLRISYCPADLCVLDWAAAVLFDQDCDETLQTIEFANLQLLEFRHIDNRLDKSLSAAYGLLHPLTRSRLPFWSSQERALRTIGELKLEANVLFERTSNVLKLVGDQYLARVYRLLSTRFHLEEWEENIQRKLEAVESAYQIVSDQAAAHRMELLELIVVILILMEIVLALFRHG